MTQPDPAKPAAPAASKMTGGEVVMLLALVFVPMGVSAAFVHAAFSASWLVSCLLSPLAVVALVVFAWIKQNGRSGSYGTYQALQKLFGRKP